MTIISTTVDKNPLEKMEWPSLSTKEPEMQYWEQSQINRTISVLFQVKPFNITVIQVYAPTTNAEEGEDEWFYDDLQDLLELTPLKDIFFIIGVWNVRVGSQEIPGVTGKFGLGVQNEAGQRLTEF